MRSSPGYSILPRVRITVSRPPTARNSGLYARGQYGSKCLPSHPCDQRCGSSFGGSPCKRSPRTRQDHCWRHETCRCSTSYATRSSSRRPTGCLPARYGICMARNRTRVSARPSQPTAGAFRIDGSSHYPDPVPGPIPLANRRSLLPGGRQFPATFSWKPPARNAVRPRCGQRRPRPKLAIAALGCPGQDRFGGDLHEARRLRAPAPGAEMAGYCFRRLNHRRS
jgi:hypothetical protein